MHSNLRLIFKGYPFQTQKSEGYLGFMQNQKLGLMIISHLSVGSGVPVQTVLLVPITDFLAFA